MDKSAVGGSIDEVRRHSWRDIWERLWPLMRPHRWRMLLSAGLVALVGVAVAITPLFTKYVIDQAIPRKSVLLAGVAMAVFLGSQWARMLFWYIAQTIALLLKDTVMFGLRSQGFGHVQKLCLRFHHQHSAGELYDRIFGSSANAVSAFLLVFFRQVVVYVVGLVFSLAFCLYLSPLMTLVILAGAGFYVLITRKMSPIIYQQTLACNDTSSRLTGFVMDKLRGTKTIQAYGMEDRVQAEFDRHVWDMHMQYNQAERQIMKLSFVTEGISYVLTAVVLVCGAWMVIHRGLAVGTLVAFVAYQGQFIGMISSLTGVFGQFASAQAGFDHLFTVMDTRSSLKQNSDGVMPQDVRGDLQLRDLSFAYSPGKPVLQKINLTIPAGQLVALVGRSGSGKTTLANLLMRFYDPDEGMIELDGQDVRELPLRGYRSLYGVVLQDPYLFDDTVAGNLRCARPEATDEELEQALRLACAWEFVSQWPEGMNHRVGENGSGVSGGQRQRLAIARCMLLRSRFVILDEPTSALDVESEHKIQALRQTR